MNDKKIDLATFYISVKRIECLLEEVIFRQILTVSNGNVEEANDTFKAALKNVSAALQQDLEALPDAK